ncbi:hypothetical protein GDO86_013300 [Hymenochirus boettgeri]|uniref:Homeobox domain-containing protein n=1 Tax=Hymenochirus boettgeri TaxID=247094 RepID=A0A8T2IU93_9PIPI|nr:hypothetical protein GDO86_013300 [Hymenochirus boettgeri]
MDLLGYNFGYPVLPLSSKSKNTGTVKSPLEWSKKENCDLRNVPNGNITSSLQPPIQLQDEPQECQVSSNILKDDPACLQSQSHSERGSNMKENRKETRSALDEDANSRARTKFTPEQLEELEKSFKGNRYIGSSEKRRLSKVLKLSENQIKTWFQNRRMKFKRQSQDARVEAFFSGLYLPYYGDIQTPACSVPPEFPVLAPNTIATAGLPFVPLHSTVNSSGTPTIPTSSPGTFPYSSMILQPMLHNRTLQRYSPY